jgi:uncharacterized membrane-anchored protein
MSIRSAFLVLLFLATFGVNAADEAASAQFEASLKYQHGDIELPGGIATLKLPETFRYLAPDAAKRLLEEGWGNPEGGGTLGMLVPSDASPVQEQGWGVVITYDEDGHVSDSDADSIDYEKLLKEMQETVVAQNAEREQQGYGAIELVGWAEHPHYDKNAKKMYWAKELKIGESPAHTLNYNIRILGRKGVLVLNAVAGMPQLEAIQDRMRTVLAFTDFKPGYAYNDFDPNIDKTAAYGLAALVAGGIAAKAGLFAKLFALAIAFKKVIAVAVIGLIAGIRKFFGRKRDENSAS